MSARPDNIIDIGAALDAPEDAPEFAQEGDLAPFGGHDDEDDYDARPLPPECPVTCLGVLEQRCWYLDVNGQIISLEMANKHGKNSLIGLFGRRRNWLEKHFPQWSKPVREYDQHEKRWVIIKEAEIIGFDQAKASEALIIECTRRGIFDPAGRIRGAGAHRGDRDALILHLGDQVMRRRLRMNGEGDEIEFFPTGLYGDHVYPAAPALPRPWAEPVSRDDGVVLLDLLRGWPWKREQLDPLLVMGAIGASQIGGALDWRSSIWLTGGKGTGKSTLNGKRGVLDQLIGKGQLRSANTTAAGIRQRLRNSTVPVFLDELEAEKDGRRTEQVLELARVSSSGDDAHRGGADHQAMEFTLQSSFWASSILIPAMEPQDKSRWAVCSLNPIPAGAPKPDLKKVKLPDLGRKMLRRMIDGWDRWTETLGAYQDALSDMGHSARACDQFGTLLAAADLMLYDKLTTVRVDQICELAPPSTLREVAEAAEDHELCLTHLRTSMVQSRGGDERQSIGTWIGAAVQELSDTRDMHGRLLVESQHLRRLGELGIKIVCRTDKGGAAVWEPKKRGYLAIANSHQALSAIFANQKWANGVWSQSLERFPGAVESVTTKVAMKAMRVTLVPLEEVIDESEIPAPARWTKEGGQ